MPPAIAADPRTNGRGVAIVFAPQSFPGTRGSGDLGASRRTTKMRGRLRNITAAVISARLPRFAARREIRSEREKFRAMRRIHLLDLDRLTSGTANHGRNKGDSQLLLYYLRREVFDQAKWLLGEEGIVWYSGVLEYVATL